MSRTPEPPNPSTPRNMYTSYYWHFSFSRGLKSIAIKIHINCQANSLTNYLLHRVFDYQANICCKCSPMFSDIRSLNVEWSHITKI